MRVPNVPERMKEVPAHALRALFAGIGQALLVSDRMRRKLTGQQAPEAAPHGVRVPVTTPKDAKPAPAPAAKAAPAPAAEATAETVAAQPAKPAPAPAVKPAPAPAAKATPETAPAATPAPAPATKPEAPSPSEASQLPIANYDQLSVPSLRARLRGLGPEQVRQLLSYEKAHGSRSDVITMYERRIQKLSEAGS